MSTGDLDDGHLDDSALVRVLDGEASAAETEHVRTCLPCRTRLGRIEERAGRLAGLLQETDQAAPPPAWDPAFLERMGVAAEEFGPVAEEPGQAPAVETPAREVRRLRRPSGGALRWAAAVALLAAAVAAPPVRAFLVEAVATVRAMVAGSEPVAPVGEGGEVSAVELSVGGPTLTLSVGAGVAVRLVPGGDGGTAVVRVISGNAEQADILVRIDGFAVTGAGDGTAIEVRVPAAVDRVRIERPGAPAREVAAPRDSAVTVGPGG